MIPCALPLLWVVAAGADSASHAVIYVDASQVQSQVDPRFFGLFTEHIFDSLDWRLAAQKVKGRGFESGDTNQDGVGEHWRPVGEAEFSLDTATSLPRFESGASSTSQRLLLKGGTAGILQENFALTAGDALDLSCHIQAQGRISLEAVFLRLPHPGAPVNLAEEDAWDILTRGQFPELPVSWEKRALRLVPEETVFPCALLLLATGDGALWMDQVSAIPASSFSGWRRDVIQRYEWLKPGTLRYPGGNFCQTYRFKDGLGPVDMRPVKPSPAWKNYPEPNTIGTDEFLRLCESLRIEPILCLNIGDTGGRNTLPDNSTDLALEECPQWWEYCNGDKTSPWGVLRAKNGHPKPYGVRLWEVGNEIGYGHIHGQLTSEQYADKFIPFAKILRAKDPEVEIIACGHDPAWNKLLAGKAKDLMDFIAIHIYDNVPFPEDCMAHPVRDLPGWLDSHIRALKEAGVEPKDLRLVLNEWSYSWTHWGRMDRAVAAVGLLHECLKRSEWIAMTNNSDSVVRFRNNEAAVFPDPECLAIAILAHHTGSEVVRCDADGPSFETVERGVSLPALDAVATRQGNRLMLSCINRSPQGLKARCVIEGIEGPARSVGSWGIRPQEPSSRISFDTPDGIRIEDLGAVLDPELLRLPGESVTVFEMEIAPASGGAQGRMRGTVHAEADAVANALVTLMPQKGGSILQTTTDASGSFEMMAEPGVYRLSAVAAGFQDPMATPCLVTTEDGPDVEVHLKRPEKGKAYDEFSGDSLRTRKWTATAFEGGEGSVVVSGGIVSVQSPEMSRFGLLSEPLNCQPDQALIFEAKVSAFTGLNALVHLTTQGHEGDFKKFFELGVEAGHQQVWGCEGAFTGSVVSAPATLKILVGPSTPSGRTVAFFINGELVQRVTDQAWLDHSAMRFFLYGWGEGKREWDWVKVEKRGIKRKTLLEDDFDALDFSTWQEASAQGGQGRMSCEQGVLRIEGVPDSRYGLMTSRIPQRSSEVLVATARLKETEGLNGLLCLLSGGPGDYRGAIEVGLERGKAQAWLGDWSRATTPQKPPVILRLVAGPLRADGTRRVRAYVNDLFVSFSPHLPGMTEDLRLFLYQWGTSKSAWDWVKLERVDVSDLASEALWPEDFAG